MSWTVNDLSGCNAADRTYVAIQVLDGEELVCELISDDYYADHDRLLATAKLIAAAPEMLWLLKCLYAEGNLPEPQKDYLYWFLRGVEE